MSDVKYFGMPPQKVLPVSLKQSANESDMMIPGNSDSFENSILGNKKSRGRRQLHYEEYKRKTLAKVAQIKTKIEAVKGNEKEDRRLKNMISAYESRLTKRQNVEATSQKLSIKVQ